MAEHGIYEQDIVSDWKAKAFWMAQRKLTKISAATGKVLGSVDVATWCASSVDVDPGSGADQAGLDREAGTMRRIPDFRTAVRDRVPVPRSLFKPGISHPTPLSTVFGICYSLGVMNREIQSVVGVIAAVLLTACNRPGYTGSGLPETLTSESLVEQVGASQGVKIVDRGGGGGKDLRSHEVHSQYLVAMTSGTAGEFLTSLRTEIQRRILASGETLYGSETVVPAGLRDFAFHYASDHHKGVIRIYTANTSTNTFRLIMFSYEHHINGPPYGR